VYPQRDKDIDQELFLKVVKGDFNEKAIFFHSGGQNKEAVYLSVLNGKWNDVANRERIVSDLFCFNAELDEDKRGTFRDELSKWALDGTLPQRDTMQALEPTQKFDDVFACSLMRTSLKDKALLEEKIHDHYKK